MSLKLVPEVGVVDDFGTPEGWTECCSVCHFTAQTTTYTFIGNVCHRICFQRIG